MLESGDLFFDLYGAAVSETEQRGVELSMAGRLRHPYSFAYLRITASATFIPSIAADAIPPAYPAPSPQG